MMMGSHLTRSLTQTITPSVNFQRQMRWQGTVSPRQKVGGETKIEIGLSEITVKMQFGLPAVEDGTDSGLEEQHLNLSMGDIRVIVFLHKRRIKAELLHVSL
jgi:hypothetical protein